MSTLQATNLQNASSSIINSTLNPDGTTTFGGIVNFASGQTFPTLSDARDKIVEGPVPLGLDFVTALEPVSFHFKETRDSENPHGPKRYGFLAQDILALEGEDPVLVDAGEEDKLRLTDSYFTPVLVNAIKELAAEIDSLKAELAALKAN
jgi:hypothetical protein